MSKLTISSKPILFVLLVGLLFGFGVGIGLAGRNHPVEAQAQNQETQVEDRGQSEQSQPVFYHRASGLSFFPTDSNWAYFHTTNGCLYRPNDSSNLVRLYTYDLQLPHGAEITTFNVYYFDNSPSDLTVELYALSGTNITTLIEDASSTAANGYGSTNSGVFSHLVDNISESLTMIVRIGPDQDVDLKLCSIRITYEFDISTNYLPSMLNMASP
jgi:hypothetical protein